MLVYKYNVDFSSYIEASWLYLYLHRLPGITIGTPFDIGSSWHADDPKRLLASLVSNSPKETINSLTFNSFQTAPWLPARLKRIPGFDFAYEGCLVCSPLKVAIAIITHVDALRI